MPLNDTILNIGNAASQTAITYLQIHTAQPNASGSNEATSARQSITWVTAANGDIIATVDLNFTGGASSGPATHVGFWSAVTTGTFYGWLPLTGDQTFNAAGEYTVTGVTITGTATKAVAEAVHLVEAIDSVVTANPSAMTTVQTLTAAELGAAGFANSDDVLILFWALLSQANAATEQAWRITYNSAALTNTVPPQRDSFGTVNTGRNVGWFGWTNLATLNDIDFDHQRVGTSANISVRKSRLAAIRLSDFGTENTDWYRNVSTTNVAHTTTYSGTNRATVTWTPDEVVDWIVLMQTHTAVDSTSVNAEARAFLDGTTVVAGDWSEEGGSTTEEWSQWTWGIIPALSTSSHTVTVETRDDTATAANDHRESRLFIFKASKWPDLKYNLGTTPVSLGAGGTDVQVATVTASLSAAQNALIVGTGRMITGETPAGGWMWVRQAGSTVIPPVTNDSVGVAVADWANQDTTDECNALWVGYASLSSGAQDLDLFAAQSAASARNLADPKLLVWGLGLVAAPNDGAATGTIGWAGTATGTNVHRGASTGTIGWAGSSTGVRVAKGAGTGAVAWVGVATGSAPVVVQEGAGIGTIGWAGTATGTNVHTGPATGAVSWAGSATGTNVHTGASTGTIIWAGATTGVSVHRGTSTGTVAWVGTADGVAPAVGVQDGAANGTIGWAGTATGVSVHRGAGTGTISWAGTSTGTASRRGAATGSVTWAGVVVGGVPATFFYDLAGTGPVSGGTETGGAAGGMEPDGTERVGVEVDGRVLTGVEA